MGHMCVVRGKEEQSLELAFFKKKMSLSRLSFSCLLVS